MLEELLEALLLELLLLEALLLLELELLLVLELLALLIELLELLLAEFPLESLPPQAVSAAQRTRTPVMLRTTLKLLLMDVLPV